MPDEPKSPPSPPSGEQKPTADQPAIPGGVKSTPSGSVQAEPKPAKPDTKPKHNPPAQKTETNPVAPAVPKAPAASATPAAKPAVPAAAHPAPPKPVGPVPTPWDSPLVARFKREYGSGVEALTHLGQ